MNKPDLNLANEVSEFCSFMWPIIKFVWVIWVTAICIVTLFKC